jgi:hypothetical protein
MPSAVASGATTRTDEASATRRIPAQADSQAAPTTGAAAARSGLTHDTIGDWDHLRGFETHVEPPSSSRYNVFYDVYDDVHNGNLVVASLYWERIEPTMTPGTLIARRATRVLRKQLELIDRA